MLHIHSILYIYISLYINKTPDCNHQPSRVALGRSSHSPDQAQKFMAVSFGSSTCGIPRINLRKLGIQKKNMLYQDWKVLEMLLPFLEIPQFSETSIFAFRGFSETTASILPVAVAPRQSTLWEESIR